MSYKDYTTTFTKTAIFKPSAKYSDNTGKNFKAIVYPRMLENVRNSLKIEINKFAKLLITLEKWLHINTIFRRNAETYSPIHHMCDDTAHSTPVNIILITQTHSQAR